MAELLDQHGPDFERISKLAAGYQLTFQLDWVDDLATEHDVTLLGQ